MAYGNDLRASERKSCLNEHTPPAQEAPLCTSDASILNEGARVFPIAETKTIVIWSTCISSMSA